MENKLNQITPTYRSFETNQVLTADQLNEFLNYFDDQDRLSRIFLSGTGIVSGFNVKYEIGDGGAVIIQLSQGAGITTDGDLINLLQEDGTGSYQFGCKPFKYTHFRTFSDINGDYQPFFYYNNVQLPLQELVFGDEAAGATPLVDLTDTFNKVVLLYLETYTDTSDACTGIDCDNLGVKHIRKLRTLLVSREDADKIMSHDKEFNQHYLIKTYLNLDDVAVQRVTVNATNSTTFAALRSSYLDAIQAESIVDKLKHGFKTMLDKVGMSDNGDDINSMLTTLLGVNASVPPAYFQYRYDLLRDVADAYNELKEMFLDSVCCCCPELSSFPKHLMLGMLRPTEEEKYITKPYRHGFYKSPILSCDGECTLLFKSQVERVESMLRYYVSTESLPMEIKITPSSYRSVLSNKAIPYYYDFQNDLLMRWSYEKAVRNEYRRNLSYRTALLEQSGPVQFPLKYNLEPHNFLRIEGHQRNDYRVALSEISQLRDQYGLAFDVKALSINLNPTDTINIDDYQCEFEDLNLMLDAWTQEHECILGKVSHYFSAFSTAVPGYNYLEDEYYHPVTKPYFEDAEVVKSPAGNAVLDEAYNFDGALGKILVEKFRAFRGCSGRDIIAQIDRELDKVPDTKPATNDATLAIPGQILSFAYVLLEKRPHILPDITLDLIDTINTNVESLCSSARQGLVKYPLAEIEGLSVRNVKMLTTLSTDLTALCCSAEKLQLIYDEIEKRKQEILLGLNLAKFQEQHPGLEHFAGTKQGGTFLLVYVESQIGSIPANTVVADFTLPYLCCSDCKSINFIMPKPVAALRLSTNTYCLGKSEGPIELFPYPSDGVVKFSPEVPGMTVNGNQLLIDQAFIPDSIIGQPVTFTVNDQVTDATLTFYRAPVINFDAQPTSPGSNVILFTPLFQVPTNLNLYTYLWEFGDGTTSTDTTVTHQFTLPVSDSGLIGNKLTVTPKAGGCSVSIAKELYFAPITISLPLPEYCEDVPAILITISPDQKALPLITGPGVIFKDRAFRFLPSSAGPGVHTLYCNGVAGFVVIVNPVPAANLAAKNADDVLKLTSNLKNADTFEWTFTNSVGEPVHDPITSDLNPSVPFSEITVEAGEPINIQLSATNECNTYNFKASIIKPTTYATCAANSQSKISEYFIAFENLYNEGNFSDQGALIMDDAYSFYQEITSDYTPYLTGEYNEMTGNNLTSLLYRFYMEILLEVNQGTDTGSLEKAYFNMMYLGFTIVRCQDEDTFTSDEIINMIGLLIKETDPANSASLQNLGINVDPENANTEFLNAILDLRTEGSESWNLVNSLIVNITPNAE